MTRRIGYITPFVFSAIFSFGIANASAGQDSINIGTPSYISTRIHSVFGNRVLADNGDNIGFNVDAYFKIKPHPEVVEVKQHIYSNYRFGVAKFGKSVDQIISVFWIDRNKNGNLQFSVIVSKRKQGMSVATSEILNMKTNNKIKLFWPNGHEIATFYVNKMNDN